MILGDQLKFVPLLNSANISTGSDTDSVNMAGFHSITYLISFGTVTTDVTVTVNSGATEGTKTTAVTFNYASGGAAIGTAAAGSTASCDVLSAWGSSASLSFTTATNKFLVVEVEASAMDTANKHNWITMTLAAGTSGIAYVTAVLVARYANNRSVTCLK